MRPKYRQHPLIVLANNHRIAHDELLRWLNDMHLVSDLAPTLSAVHYDDAMEVMKRCRAPWTKMYFQ